MCPHCAAHKGGLEISGIPRRGREAVSERQMTDWITTSGHLMER
jgi:hypothetical protein